MSVYLISGDVYREIVKLAFPKGGELSYSGSVKSMFPDYSYVEYEDDVYLLDKSDVVPEGKAFILQEARPLENFSVKVV